MPSATALWSWVAGLEVRTPASAEKRRVSRHQTFDTSVQQRYATSSGTATIDNHRSNRNYALSPFPSDIEKSVPIATTADEKEDQFNNLSKIGTLRFKWRNLPHTVTLINTRDTLFRRLEHVCMINSRKSRALPGEYI